MILPGTSMTTTRSAKLLIEKKKRYMVLYANYEMEFFFLQRGFFETMDDKHNTKLSSAGLVYKHFGKEMIANLLGKQAVDDEVKTIFARTYNVTCICA